MSSSRFGGFSLSASILELVEPAKSKHVQFQMRTSDHAPSRYPLSLDQRVAQGHNFRLARERLKVHLHSIELFYTTPESGSHTGQPDCNRCITKKKQIRQAYHQYYLAPDSGQWDSGLYQYREQMERMFSDPAQYTLADIHLFFQHSLREHLKGDLCTTRPSDDTETYAFKEGLNAMFGQGRPTVDILSFYLTEQLNRASPDAAEFIAKLQNTTTPEERAQIYIKYYCSSNWNDDATLKNFKAKYTRVFLDLLSHDAVLAAMHKEAEESQADKLKKLREKLADVQMAKSAHLKDKKRKAEKADQRMMDREEEAKSVGCGLPRCHREVNLREEAIECAVCDWLERNGGEKGRVFYCSVEHAEEDFDEHDRNDHRCCMGDRCYFHPQAGPPGETEACGVCPDCSDNDIASYFCSNHCFDQNLDAHRDEVHYGRGIQNEAGSLDLFRPATELRIV